MTDSLAAEVTALVDAELAAHPRETLADRMLLDAFVAQRARPRAVTVNIPGGAVRTGILVTRSNGDYTLVYMPEVGLFSLCVDSIFGPVDIGVHGAALACFASV